MATFEKGDMWSVFGKTNMFLFTSNPIVNKDGLAVMGRGIAKQVADRFPEVRRDYARRLAMFPTILPSSYVGTYDGQDIGYFMVKNHWRDNADLDVIRLSVMSVVDYLAEDAAEYGNDNPLRFDLNFPGIGNGRLSREDVLPLLEPLPDNVHVWEYGS